MTKFRIVFFDDTAVTPVFVKLYFAIFLCASLLFDFVRPFILCSSPTSLCYTHSLSNVSGVGHLVNGGLFYDSKVFL